MKNLKSLFFIINALMIIFGHGELFAHHSKHLDVVIYWNNTALNRIQVNSTNPPRAARTLYLTHNAAFNAYAAYDDDVLGTTRGDTLRRPEDEQTRANKEKAISFAAFRVLSNLFPSTSSS